MNGDSWVWVSEVARSTGRAEPQREKRGDMQDELQEKRNDATDRREVQMSERYR